MATVSEKLHELIDDLSLDQQHKLLDFAQMLKETDPFLEALPKSKLPPGTPGSVLLRFTLPLEDAEEMERALEDCERIEPDEY
ncbi:MAG TPA: hypothetical protein VJ761_15935 [Ktedonobacteraceae bacterium]|nr:hypothetical protein [Ktedonobacteraceae bacterium]